MTGKDYLKQVEQANIRMKLHESELKRIKNEIVSIAGVDYSAPSVQNSKKTDLSERIARLEEAEKKNREAYLNLSKLVEEVVGSIKKVKNATLCLLLYYRYIELNTWDEVAEKINRTTRAIHRSLHKQAIKEIEKINKNTSI